MNIEYTHLTGQDSSRIIYSSDANKSDLRNEVIRLASKNNNNIYKNMRVTSKQSRFLNVSVELEKKLKITNFKLNKLDELSNQSTLFNSEDAKISELIVSIKESIKEVQIDIDFLSKNNDLIYSRQAEQMGKNIFQIINMRHLETSKLFKDVLQRRAEKIKKSEEKGSVLAPGAGKTGDRSKKAQRNGAMFLKDKGRGHVDLEGVGSGGQEHADGGSGGQMQAFETENEYRKTRSESIRNIEKMLGEVATIFQRISTLVELQEQMVERIDKDSEETLDNSRKAKKELVKYWDYVRKQRSLLIKIFIIMLVISTIYVVFLS